MKFNINIRDIVITVLAVILFWNLFIDIPDVEPEPVSVSIPEQSGTAEKVIRSIKVDTVEIIKYLPGKVKNKIVIVVDSTYKDKYEKAVKDNDSLAAKNLFLQSISINEYNENVVSNDSININAYIKTRGQLLDYKVSWTIEEREFVYTPKVVKAYPKLSLVVGGELVIINDPVFDAGFKLDVGVQNKKGDIFSVGRDTNGNYYLGYKRSFRILK
jgi:hypothetical protein